MSATDGFKVKNQDISNPLSITGAVVTDTNGSATNVMDSTGGSIFANTAHATVITTSGSGGATAEEVRIEMDSNSKKLKSILNSVR